MSDFLSNFNNDNYKKEPKEQLVKSQPVEESEESFQSDPEIELSERKRQNSRQKSEITEVDETYKGKRKRKKRQIILGVIILVILSIVFYYRMSHVRIPNFTDKKLSEARVWATKNKLQVEVKQEHSLHKAANTVLKQSVKAGNQVKKGGTIRLTISEGPDPEQQIKIPDFSTMNEQEAKKWINENQATNLSLIEEYSDTVKKTKYLRLEIANTEVNQQNYRRKDAAKLFYSKGKEIYKKDITVPDFARKNRSEVETWARNNDIAMTYEEATSKDIPADSIISQNVAANEKVAKKDAMTVVVSLGKGFTIPDFADYTLDDASTALDGVQVQVKGVYTNDQPYGQLVSQSVPSGTVLNSKDELKVQVTYSLGQPYLKDLRGNTLEGDLQKYFYDEFQSKGANINYVIRHVDSDQPKGTVVGMSTYSVYLPLEYTVSIDISMGNLGSAPTNLPNNQNQQQGTSDGNDNSQKQETSGSSNNSKKME